jgi:predicted  nucleic acid-binding Zn-ribbon protein
LEQELRTLFEAQQVDSQIAQWERKMISAPNRLDELDKEMEEMRERIAREKELIDELEKERRRKEKELEAEKDKVKKLEARLYEVKTNKEYQALLKEIETLKVGSDKTEEDVILLMDQVEELRKDYQSATSLLSTREKEVDGERKGLRDEIQSIDRNIADLRQQRENLLSVVNTDLKKTYETLLERRGGLAVVNVKDAVCMGCFMNIPPQYFIEVTKNLKLNACPSCNRILFFAGDE